MTRRRQHAPYSDVNSPRGTPIQLGVIELMPIPLSSLRTVYRKLEDLVAASLAVATVIGSALHDIEIKFANDPPAIVWSLLFETRVSQDGHAVIADYLKPGMPGVPTWSGTDITQLLVLSAVTRYHLTIHGVTVHFVTHEPPAIPSDHVDAFLDFARRQDKPGFTDLARMVLQNLSPDEIEAMWSGTLARLRTESKKG